MDMGFPRGDAGLAAFAFGFRPAKVSKGFCAGVNRDRDPMRVIAFRRRAVPVLNRGLAAFRRGPHIKVVAGANLVAARKRTGRPVVHGALRSPDGSAGEATVFTAFLRAVASSCGLASPGTLG
jgi:hypothetical protein